MAKLLLAAVLWILGSVACYKIWGTSAILPYAGTTLALAALYVWLQNRKPRA